MKKLVALLLSLSMLAGLAACGGTSAGTTAAPEQSTAAQAATEQAGETSAAAETSGEEITLRMIDTLASEKRTAAIQSIIDKYQAENPNVKIELISPPTDGADQKVQQMLMSDEPLDIIDTGNQFQICVNNGWVQPLNDYIADWEELGTLSSAAASRMTLFDPEGKLQYHIPYGLYQQLLFYRIDLLEAAGIEIPEVWTWENIYEISTKVTNPSAGVYGWAMRGGSRGFSVFDKIMFSFLGDKEIVDNENYRFFSPDGTVVFRSENALKALEYYKSLYKDCAPSDSISWGFTEMVQGFMSGSCAILLQENDVIQSVQDGLDPAVWGVGNVPIGPSGYGTQSAGYGGWALTANSEHPEEAVKFLLFLSNAENNGYYCEQTGLIPIHTTTIEENDFFSSGAYTIYNKMDEMGTYRIMNAGGVAYDCAATFDTDRDEHLQKYLTDQISAEDLLDYWASTWEEGYEAQGQLW